MLYTSCWVGSEWMLSQGSGPDLWWTAQASHFELSLCCPPAPGSTFSPPSGLTPTQAVFKSAFHSKTEAVWGWEWIMSKAPSPPLGVQGRWQQVCQSAASGTLHPLIPWSGTSVAVSQEASDAHSLTLISSLSFPLPPSF